ncbi:AMP-binding protein, partial [Staphylococcus epidermidis]|uniref:AMP-binding protein n=1 Tax=Staphylococcus epidermidis TaxID=1282 RepID=UPI0011A7418D
LEYEEGWMRYDELNECANVLAYRLGLNDEIEGNDMVGLIGEGRLEMIIGMLGMLKGGGG